MTERIGRAFLLNRTEALSQFVALAFDTTNSQIVYAGTPAFAMEDVDGGRRGSRPISAWHDDSDVFSIHVDITRPLRLFASACSGIYRSADQGVSWDEDTGRQRRVIPNLSDPRRIQRSRT